MNVAVRATVIGALLLVAPMTGRQEARFESAAVPDAVPDAAPNAVTREWRVRTASREPERAAEMLRLALDAESWTERATALDACQRALATGLALPVVSVLKGPTAAESGSTAARLLADPHGDVRARTLECLRLVAAGDVRAEVELDARVAERLAADRLPAVRVALARALGLLRCDAAPQVLGGLAFDVDVRVARAARCSLFGAALGAPGMAVRIRVVRTLYERGHDAEWLACVEWSERGEAEPAQRVELATAMLAYLPLDASDERARGCGSVFAAHALASSKSTGSTDAAAAWTRVLVAGWHAAGAPSLTRRRILRRAGRHGGEGLARAWLILLRDSHGSAHLADVAASVMHCVTPQRAFAMALNLGLDEFAWGVLLPELGARLSTWDGLACARFFEEIEGGASPELRRIAVNAAAATLHGTRGGGDAAAAAWIASALDDSDDEIVWDAFWNLCRFEDGRDVQPWAQSLALAWDGLSVDRKSQALGRLPDDVPLPEFRGRILGFGEDGAGDGKRGIAAAALGSYAGDDGVVAHLLDWLEQDLARFASTPSSDRATRRRFELAVRGELRALAAWGRDATGPARASVDGVLEAALVRAHGASEEIGIAAVKGLGRTALGRARLAQHLHTGVDRRVRIEAALALAPHANAKAADLLMRELDGADAQLRPKMLRALAGADTNRTRIFLEALLFSDSSREADRMGALDALARARNTLAMERAARAGDAVEVRRAALRALGRMATSEARAVLVRVFQATSEACRWERTDGARFTAEDEGVLRAEWFAAAGAARLTDTAASGQWLRDPVEASAFDLERRFEGHEPALPELRWWGEIAFARGLGAAGRLDAVLGETDRWWCMDGELLAALAALRPSSSSPAQLELARAAVVALSGTGSDMTRSRRTGQDTRMRVLGLAWESERWTDCVSLLRALLADYRIGAVHESTWRAAFGEFSPGHQGHQGRAGDEAAGVDPVARVRAARWQAQAWALLEGEGAPSRPGVERAASAAERELGRSAVARREQSRLRSAIASRFE